MRNKLVRELLKTRVGTGLNFAGADLSDLDLSGCELANTDFSCAYLRGADLTGANLKSAILIRADLFGATLRAATLLNANLRDACLKQADLRDAQLSGANLSGADLQFSAWPLWCGSLDVRLDTELKKQLLYHALVVGRDLLPPATRRQACIVANSWSGRIDHNLAALT